MTYSSRCSDGRVKRKGKKDEGENEAGKMDVQRAPVPLSPVSPRFIARYLNAWDRLHTTSRATNFQRVSIPIATLSFYLGFWDGHGAT